MAQIIAAPRCFAAPTSFCITEMTQLIFLDPFFLSFALQIFHPYGELMVSFYRWPVKLHGTDGANYPLSKHELQGAVAQQRIFFRNNLHGPDCTGFFSTAQLPQIIFSDTAPRHG